MKPCEMLERDGNKARRTWPAVIDSHPGAARWNRNMIGLTGRAECHAMPPQDESAERAETDGGSRKPILVRILLTWEAAQRRKADKFIRRHKHLNSFY
jgi:hypothetical protein